MQGVMRNAVKALKSSPKASAIAGSVAGASVGGFVAHRGERRRGLRETANAFSAGNSLGRQFPDKPIHATARGARGLDYSGPLYDHLVNQHTAKAVVQKMREKGHEAKLAFWIGFEKRAAQR